MEEVKKDLKVLVADIESHLVQKEEIQFLEPLRYRFEIIRSKMEKANMSFVRTKVREEIEQNAEFAMAVLY